MWQEEEHNEMPMTIPRASVLLVTEQCKLNTIFLSPFAAIYKKQQQQQKQQNILHLTLNG